MAPDRLFESMVEAWTVVGPRFEAYNLLLPGNPRFVCQPEVCTAYCCHAYSVNLGDSEVDRFRRFESMDLVEFLEVDENGEPIKLPMAQPYLLARADGHRKMLGEHLGCTTYDGRPNACRLYPHFVVFWDPEAERARTTPSRRAAAAAEAASLGNTYGLIPMLLGHSECPGFTGPPLEQDDWFELFRRTYQLQYVEV